MAGGALVLLMAGAPAVVAEQSLSSEVVEALEAGNCKQLMRLNRRYWRLAESTPSEAMYQHTALALESAILGDPLCGRADAELIRVEPQQGVNFFNPHEFHVFRSGRPSR
ncbi:hypothetical protein CAI21_00280 [Alkalilimnicola ehrlichii]|nr:hypothetical protein CAI21_00280 [Alkalilimnicola ehrlichii]